MTKIMSIFLLFFDCLGTAHATSDLTRVLSSHPSSSSGKLSPPYNYMFQFPLPIPPAITPSLSYTDAESNVTIDFFQLNITSFQAQIYPNLAKTSLVGYNGISPGPTFKIDRPYCIFMDHTPAQSGMAGRKT
ncbi:hypothetical protein TGAMA5MH_02426 [Trichoderma gamsii]|uniref:Uncharacterized protein n=1 Tax=Trichoderma gamsii TaxID=398673 RepID=A0A2K0TLJ0_9HYPO|nr:hypothetical protein TGAMA5MH_02426 [Trichoderma gamsii]